MISIDDKNEVIDRTEDEIVPYCYSITSYGADYPVDMLVKRLDDEVIFVPAFQRQYVWTLKQASRFIESLLLGLPVPGIFLSKEQDTQKLIIIDGQQRLSTLYFFYNGIFKPSGIEFKLKGVQKNFEGKSFKDLTNEEKLKLNDSIIHATIVKQDEPSEDESSIYHIFERLNTGGTSLQPQEIRACIYRGDFNDLIHSLNKNKSWRYIYGKESNKLKDEELILRFFALYFNLDNYKIPLKEFLNKFMAHNRTLKFLNSEDLNNTFINSIDFIKDVLKKDAFRLVGRGLAAAIFDSVMVGTTDRIKKGPVKDKSDYLKKYKSLLENDEYLKFVNSGTSAENVVKGRLEIARKTFSEVI